MIDTFYDCVVVGAGPAGMSSAYGAAVNGAKNVLVIERDEQLGGILPQCIHTGFGIEEFKEELTGPEYSDRWIKKAKQEGVEFLLNTTVMSFKELSAKETKNLKPDLPKGMTFKQIDILGPHTGILSIYSKTVILAMGCREKPRGTLAIPGTRCAGIYTAGCAQRLVNIQGVMPGQEVVILGSGDIGLIMARRMKIEGADVKMVIERQNKSGGLMRNVVQCLDDFGIELLLSATILEIHGKKRVEAVTIGQFDENDNLIPKSVKKIPCDTVLLSVGLIPENELCAGARVQIDPLTAGPKVDKNMQTNISGVFSCGNALRVYDLVDNVSKDSVNAGHNAGKYIKGNIKTQGQVITSFENENQVKPLDLNLEEIDGVKKLICTVCPVGCKISIKDDGSGEYIIEGNKCERGLKFAKDEILSPVRTLTTSVLQRLKYKKDNKTYWENKEIAVRTDRPIPLDKLMDAADAVKDLRIDSEVQIGQILIRQVANTDANIIVTRP